jgi:spermidine synthase
MLKKFSLEIIVFLCGASLMTMEIVASRALAPYFGTSTMVWTILIGVIMACLSFGYWYGGKLADRNPTSKTLGKIISIAGFSILLVTFIFEPISYILNQLKFSNQINSLLATILLFSVPSIALGMVSPYSVKLKLTNLNNAASTVGRLYSISTVGSIIGTFSAGLILIPTLGTARILLSLAGILIFISLFLNFKFLSTIIGILSLTVLFSSIGDLSNSLFSIYLVDTDSSYSRIIIKDTKDPGVRSLMISGAHSSANFLKNDEVVIDDLVFDYLKYYDLVQFFKPDFKNTLFIGGAAYTYPNYFLQKFPKARMDVVEIDPKVTILAKKYFNLKENSRLKIIHEDGRIFLGSNTNKYDSIMIDAFSSRSIPFHLTTLEFVSKVESSLNENGCVIVNLIGSFDGKNSTFFKSLYNTYQKKFPHIYAYGVNTPDNPMKNQNIILIASKYKNLLNHESSDKSIQKLLDNRAIVSNFENSLVLTDDYAPVSYLDSKRDDISY